MMNPAADNADRAQIATTMTLKPVYLAPLPRIAVLIIWSIFAGLYIVYITQFAWASEYRMREVFCRPVMPDDLETLIGVCMLAVIIPEGISHLTMITVSIFMLVRRSHEWVAMFSAVALLLISAGFSSISFGLAQFSEFASIGRGLLGAGVWAAAVFVLTFPDGRFHQPWIPWLIGVYTLWVVSWWFVPFLDLSVGITSLSFITLIIAVIPMSIGIRLKYRRSFTPAQQRQTRLVLAASIAAIAGYAISLAITFFVRASLPDTLGGTILFIFMTWVRWASVALISIAILISIVRFHLYDVDRVIVRGLLIGAITLLLAVVFGGSVLAVQQIALFMTGDNQSNLAVVLAALAVGLLFHPVRQYMQRTIDRRYFAASEAHVPAGVYAGEITTDGVRPAAPQTVTAAASGSLRQRAETHGALTGVEIGGCVLGELLGRGGMAEVYRARQIGLNRDVAIKTLSLSLSDGAQFYTRFEREGHTLASLDHPNIVRVYAAGEQDGIFYITMEFIEGKSLAQRLAHIDAPMTLVEAFHILKGVAAALDHTHAKGIVHRDVKPHNIMLEPAPDGAPGAVRPILMDFGIARLLSSHTLLTTGQGTLGTLQYIAPEQISDTARVDHRADIYALGIVTWQMLTGKLPFDDTNPGAIMMSHLQKYPPDPRTLNPDIPAHAALALLRALAKSPDDRFECAGAFVEALT